MHALTIACGIISLALLESAFSFTLLPLRSNRFNSFATPLHSKMAGSFFYQVPNDDDNSNEADDDRDLNKDLAELLQRRNSPSLASQPSTINGVPTSKATGFGKPSTPVKAAKPYIAIGEQTPAVVNNSSKPEYDDQGYTLYQDETTGQKARVFEALVEYPTLFKMKIVGLNEGLFVEEMVALVAECCSVSDVKEIQHSVKINGKWSSITVNAPVQNADMLYALYENVDRDPRVKFKF
jgi:putative lipoic acid-binding regulatory protein